MQRVLSQAASFFHDRPGLESDAGMQALSLGGNSFDSKVQQAISTTSWGFPDTVSVQHRSANSTTNMTEFTYEHDYGKLTARNEVISPVNQTVKSPNDM